MSNQKNNMYFLIQSSNDNYNIKHKKNYGMKCLCNNINYKKLVTSGNDPSISKSMRYATYVRAHGTTNAYNNGGKTFNNIGIMPELSPSQKDIIAYMKQ